MNLSGNVTGLKKGTLFLEKVDDTLLVSVDSTEVYGDAYFSFSEEIESPEVYYLYLRLVDGTLLDDRVAFFAEPGDITINTSLENFATDAVISGSANEDKLKDYDRLMQRYADKNLDLIEAAFKAQQDGNDSLYQAIQKQQGLALRGKYLATVNFAMSHKDYELAPYIVLSEIYDANTTYLDTVYNVLTPKIKDSKYGKALESFIKNRKSVEN